MGLLIFMWVSIIIVSLPLFSLMSIEKVETFKSRYQEPFSLSDFLAGIFWDFCGDLAPLSYWLECGIWHDCWVSQPILPPACFAHPLKQSLPLVGLCLPAMQLPGQFCPKHILFSHNSFSFSPVKKALSLPDPNPDPESRVSSGSRITGAAHLSQPGNKEAAFLSPITGPCNSLAGLDFLTCVFKSFKWIPIFLH